MHVSCRATLLYGSCIFCFCNVLPQFQITNRRAHGWINLNNTLATVMGFVRGVSHSFFLTATRYLLCVHKGGVQGRCSNSDHYSACTLFMRGTLKQYLSSSMITLLFGTSKNRMLYVQCSVFTYLCSTYYIAAGWSLIQKWSTLSNLKPRCSMNIMWNTKI